ncbi:MAG: crossover junction endodeoxyribonuclease RuvC [Fibrobacteraceae bacterium]|nr:crossover junction endodeoxyribonuclease RuvC [Fibrobacteraceae bacterium]
MVILGIDPGSITTGFAFIEKTNCSLEVLEYGTIHVPASKALEDRLLHIILELEALLDRYKPNSLSMEGVFFAKNAKSALVLGHIRGAVLVACRKRGMTYNEYSPRVVKQAVAGSGAASKEQVANMVFARLGIEGDHLPLDASDALAIAWTHANPAPLAGLKKRKVSKKASVEQWKKLVERMGGSING